MPDAQRTELRYQAPREPLYHVGQEWNFTWYVTEVDKVIRLYADGYHISLIARRLDREPRDVFLLLLDLAEQGRIKRMPGWIWGTA